MRHKLIHIGLINRSILLSLIVIAAGSMNQIFAQVSDPQRPPLQKGHTLAIGEVKWSPDNKLLMTYSAADGLLQVWQMPLGKLISRVKDSTIRTKADDKRFLRTFSWSSDSRLIATGAENGTAQVWEAETGKLLWSTRIADEFVTAVQFSRDKKYLAAVTSPEDQNHKLVLIDVSSGQIIKSVGTIEHRFLNYNHRAKIVFSDDSKQLVVADTGGTVTRWDLPSNSLLNTTKLDLCPGARPTNSFAYSNDLSLAVARCGLKTNVIDLNTGAILRQFSSGREFSGSIVLSNDKRLLAVGDQGGIRLINLTSGEETPLDVEPPMSCGCDFNNDASLLAVEDYFETETVKVIDVKSKQIIARLEAHPGEIKALAYSADGSVVASGSEDRVVRIWDAHTGALLRNLEGHTKRVEAVAFVPDGKLLVTASPDQSLKVWEVATGNLMRSIKVTDGYIDGVSSIAFSADGKRMVTTLRETITLWNFETLVPMSEFTNEDSTVISARFDARGRLIISAHEDGTIKVWDTTKAVPPPTPNTKPIQVLKTNERNESFALSPNEKFLIVNGGEKPPRIWNWLSKRPLRSLGEDATYAHAVLSSPDSRIVATSDIGGEINLWNVSTGKLLRVLDGGYSSNDALAFSPDGTKLASGGENQNLIMWDVKTGARLWHILPVTERHRPTAEEVAERKRAIALASAEEKLKNQVTRKLANGVSVSFSHYGEPNNPMAARFGETGRPNNSLTRGSKSDATGIWFRLRNTSRLPIGLSTASHYFMADKSCGYQTKRKFFPGLCNDSEIDLSFGLIDRQGKFMDYGFHLRFFSMLPPKTSVLFSVPREILRDGSSIVFTYNFLNEDAKGKLVEYGKARELRFKE